MQGLDLMQKEFQLLYKTNQHLIFRYASEGRNMQKNSCPLQKLKPSSWIQTVFHHRPKNIFGNSELCLHTGRCHFEKISCSSFSLNAATKQPTNCRHMLPLHNIYLQFEAALLTIKITEMVCVLQLLWVNIVKVTALILAVVVSLNSQIPVLFNVEIKSKCSSKQNSTYYLAVHSDMTKAETYPQFTYPFTNVCC